MAFLVSRPHACFHHPKPRGSDPAGQAALASAATHYATARIGNEFQLNMLGIFSLLINFSVYQLRATKVMLDRPMRLCVPRHHSIVK